MRSHLSYSGKKIKLFFTFFVVASLASFENKAFAQNAIPDANGAGIDTHLFRPALDSKGFFSVNGASILGKNDISFGLILDYGNGLLRVADKGQKNAQLIDHSFQGTAQFNYGIANILSVGLSVPVNLMTGSAQTDASSQATVPNDQWFSKQLDSQTLGFLALHAKVRLLRPEKGFGLALSAQAGLPVTDAPKNAGADPSFWYWPQLIGEVRAGKANWFKAGLNLGYRGHGASQTGFDLVNGRVVDGSRATYGLGLSARVAEPLDVVLETYGTYLLSDSKADVKMSNEAVLGLKVFVQRNSFLMLGAGKRYTNGFEAADWRGFLGFIFEPSIGDKDGDGLKDDEDQCPTEPEDFDGFEDEDGCPDLDNDKDGIPDVKDKCPDLPENIDGVEDEDGCPEHYDGDRDGDGIMDSVDKCPDDPEDKDGFEDKDGCPDPDNDKDGILDKVDQCPNDPEDKDGFEDADGCPDPDNDKDQIYDNVDKCPNDPETYNGLDDQDGCPDKGDVEIGKGGLHILKKIQFKTNSAEILPASNGILDAVAAAIKGHPEFLLLEVAGHADERSDDAHNLQLTQKRVDSVMAALVSRGVDSKRLRSKGYGEYCPEDPRHNAAAWEKNRRVEFKIVKTKDGEGQAAELGCSNAESHGVYADPVPKDE